MSTATGKTTKLAWIHDGPPGVASLGHFNCVCGNTIHDVEYAGPDRFCGQCGRVWDGRGWLVSDGPTLPADLKVTRQGEGLLGW
jgi:hypothetical protein